MCQVFGTAFPCLRRVVRGLWPPEAFRRVFEGCRLRRRTKHGKAYIAIKCGRQAQCRYHVEALTRTDDAYRFIPYMIMSVDIAHHRRRLGNNSFQILHLSQRMVCTQDHGASVALQELTQPVYLRLVDSTRNGSALTRLEVGTLNQRVQ